MGKVKLRKRLAREQRAALDGMRERLMARGIAQKVPYRERVTGVKITERLVGLIEDELEGVAHLEHADLLITLCSVGWNMAADPSLGEEQRAALLSQLPPDERAAVDTLLVTIKQRKLDKFANDLRVVVETNAHPQSDGSFYFTAAALEYENEHRRGWFAGLFRRLWPRKPGPA